MEEEKSDRPQIGDKPEAQDAQCECEYWNTQHWAAECSARGSNVPTFLHPLPCALSLFLLTSVWAASASVFSLSFPSPPSLFPPHTADTASPLFLSLPLPFTTYRFPCSPLKPQPDILPAHQYAHPSSQTHTPSQHCQSLNSTQIIVTLITKFASLRMIRTTATPPPPIYSTLPSPTHHLPPAAHRHRYIHTKITKKRFCPATDPRIHHITATLIVNAKARGRISRVVPGSLDGRRIMLLQPALLIFVSLCPSPTLSLLFRL